MSNLVTVKLKDPEIDSLTLTLTPEEAQVIRDLVGACNTPEHEPTNLAITHVFRMLTEAGILREVGNSVPKVCLRESEYEVKVNFTPKV